MSKINGKSHQHVSRVKFLWIFNQIAISRLRSVGRWVTKPTNSRQHIAWRGMAWHGKRMQRYINDWVYWTTKCSFRVYLSEYDERNVKRIWNIIVDQCYWYFCCLRMCICRGVASEQAAQTEKYTLRRTTLEEGKKERKRGNKQQHSGHFLIYYCYFSQTNA